MGPFGSALTPAKTTASMKQLWVCLVELRLLKKWFWAVKKLLLIVGCEKVESD